MLSISFTSRFFIILSLLFFSISHGQEENRSATGWISLFNGKNLDGWTVKIAGHSINDNIYNTFFAEDSILKVSYAGYDKFDMQFGHLFTNISYSHYIFRVDYKFTGSGMPDAPHWANLNSSVMLHSQSPQSMRIDQGFPVSLEGQFLAEGATAGTQTGNAVTPGTHIFVNGILTKEHVVNADSKLFPLDTWVTFEAEVHGNKEIIHRVNGNEVIRYTQPHLDDTDEDTQRLIAAGACKNVSRGYIALQAEGQPVWFKNIQIKVLKENCED